MPIPGVMAGALARGTKSCQDRGARPRAAAAEQSAERRGRIRDARQHHGRPADRRLRARHRRRVSLLGVNPAESHDRFHEAHDLILQAWTQPGPFAFEGKYYHFEYVNSLAAAACSSRIRRSGFRRRARARRSSGRRIRSRKYTYLQTFSPVDQLARFMDMYRAAGGEIRLPGDAAAARLGDADLLSDTDEIALREARPHIEAFFNKFLRMPLEMLLPPGYLSLASMQARDRQDPQRRHRPATRPSRTDREGHVPLRQPRPSRRSSRPIRSKSASAICSRCQFGTLPHDLTKTSMELFARKVMPRLRHIGEDMPAPRVHAAE